MILLSVFVLQCHLRRAILEIIASGIAQTEKDLEHFFKCTLLYLVHRHQVISLNGTHTTAAENEANSKHVALENSDPIKDSMQFLEQYEFIRTHFNEDKQENTFIATRLGYACLGWLNFLKFRLIETFFVNTIVIQTFYRNSSEITKGEIDQQQFIP